MALRAASFALCLWVSACGNPSGKTPSGGSVSDAGNDADVRTPVLVDPAELPPACSASFYRTSFDGVTIEHNAEYVNGPVWPTSWNTFKVYAQALPTATLNGVWGVGRGSEPFVDRELRTLDTVLIFASGNAPELLCAAGKRRVLRTGNAAHIALTGLGPLRCTDEPVSGELRFCNDCYYGDAAIQGELDGEEIRDVTGSHVSIGSLIYFRLGFSVLVARTGRGAGGELTLEAGAYLSLSDHLYCIGAASGALADGGVGAVTFTNFTRAEPCSAGAVEANIDICSPRFSTNDDW